MHGIVAIIGGSSIDDLHVVCLNKLIDTIRRFDIKRIDHPVGERARYRKSLED